MRLRTNSPKTHSSFQRDDAYLIDMSYGTPASFRQFSFCSGSFDSVPDVNVQSCLDIAADQIDAALRPNHQLPIPSGSVPAIVFEWERVICAYYLFLQQGLDPENSSANEAVIIHRYQQVAGVPENPASGDLGQIAYGKRALVNSSKSDSDPVHVLPSFVVAGSRKRGWNGGNRGGGGTVG